MDTAGGSTTGGAPPASLGAALQHITAPDAAPEPLAALLRKLAPPDIRDTLLGGLLPGAQDPLGALHPALNTVGVLFILSARLTSPTAAPVDPAYVLQFCAAFDPEHARFALDRVALLAKGIVKLGDTAFSPKWAIEPLHHLLTRAAPSLAHLTPLHTLLVSQCLRAGHTPPALLRPILGTPLAHISPKFWPDLHYNDALVYHYAGGMVFAGWKAWAEAEEFFEICVGSPAQTPSALQWEALKKLVLVQAISNGKISNLPKYVHPALGRLLKSSAYGAFARAYPRNATALKDIAEKDKDVFTADRNTGLLNQALARAARWNVARLTNTYLTLSLAEIGSAIGISSDDDVRRIVVSMIEESEITATLSGNTVTFADPPLSLSRADVDRVLRGAQAQSAALHALERALGGSERFLQKALKSREDDARWGGAEAEELVALGGAIGGFAEEGMYA